MHDEPDASDAWHHVLAVMVVIACGAVLVTMEVCYHVCNGIKNAWMRMKKCGKNTKSQ